MKLVNPNQGEWFLMGVILVFVILLACLSCTQAVNRGGDGGQTCPTDGAERIGQKSTAASIAEPQRLTPSTCFYYFWVDTVTTFELWRVDISTGGDSPLVVAPTTGRACANTRRPWSEIVESGGESVARLSTLSRDAQRQGEYWSPMRWKQTRPALDFKLERTALGIGKGLHARRVDLRSFGTARYRRVENRAADQVTTFIQAHLSNFTYYLTICHQHAWPWLWFDGYYVPRPVFVVEGLTTGDKVKLWRTWP